MGAYVSIPGVERPPWKREPIWGKNAVIKHRFGKDAKGLLFEGALPGIKFAMGENPKRSRGSGARARYPETRMGVIDVIREAFTEAKAYQKEWKEYDENIGRGRKLGPSWGGISYGVPSRACDRSLCDDGVREKRNGRKEVRERAGAKDLRAHRFVS